MNRHELKLFENRRIRTMWDDKAEKWYFSVVDVVGALADSDNPAVYWRVLKKRLKDEGNETVTNCNRLKLPAEDGKMRLTDVADQEQMFRIIQSIPSRKAEPFKLWMAKVASERIDQMQDPEKSISQALADYRRLGYSPKWIAQRLKSIDVRNDLTDEWRDKGITDERDFAMLTNVMYKTWAGMTAGEYKRFKGLKKQNLRDNMTNLELILSMLAEESTRQMSIATNPSGLAEHAITARRGATVSKNARMEIERRTGRPAISQKNAGEVGHLDYDGNAAQPN